MGASAELIAGANDSIQRTLVRVDKAGLLMQGGAYVTRSAVATTAPAYTANDNVGGEIQVQPSLVAVPNGVFMLESLKVIDPAGQAARLSLLLFTIPKATTLATFTDNVAAVVPAAAQAALVEALDVPVASYVNIEGTVKVASLGSLGRTIIADANGLLYMALVTTGTPTYGVSGLSVVMGWRRVGVNA